MTWGVPVLCIAYHGGFLRRVWPRQKCRREQIGGNATGAHISVSHQCASVGKPGMQQQQGWIGRDAMDGGSLERGVGIPLPRIVEKGA